MTADGQLKKNDDQTLKEMQDMTEPEIKDILHAADGISDKPMDSDEVAELIIEINGLNAIIFTLRELPNRIKREVNERYDEATQKRRKAESACECAGDDLATDANHAYWEGQCHALAAIKRALAV